MAPKAFSSERSGLRSKTTTSSPAAPAGLSLVTGWIGYHRTAEAAPNPHPLLISQLKRIQAFWSDDLQGLEETIARYCCVWICCVLPLQPPPPQLRHSRYPWVQLTPTARQRKMVDFKELLGLTSPCPDVHLQPNSITPDSRSACSQAPRMGTD